MVDSSCEYKPIPVIAPNCIVGTCKVNPPTRAELGTCDRVWVRPTAPEVDEYLLGDCFDAKFRIDDGEVWENPDLVNLCSENVDGFGINYCESQGDQIVYSNLYKPGVGLGGCENLYEHVSISQNGGRRVEVWDLGHEYWDILPEFVSIISDDDTMLEYSTIYGCDVPMALVEVGPDCFVPVFMNCVEGTCDCYYVLSGVRCQLRPCRFAAAVMGFDRDVTRDDIFVLTCVCRGRVL